MNAPPVMAMALALVTVMTMVVTPPMATGLVPNALASVGATVVDVSVLVTVAPVTVVPPTTPLGVPVVLDRAPAAVACTCTVKVQVAPAAIVPPVKTKPGPPATAVMVPPQLVVAAGALLLTMPGAG